MTHQANNDVSGRGRQLPRLRPAALLLPLVLLLLPAGAALAEPSGAPRLVVEVAEVDLGELPKGSSSEARFELHNVGDAELRILDVTTGCACAVATFDRVIAPGEVGSLTALLDTATLNGAVAKGIDVKTNDPASPHTFLTLRATVVTAVRVEPADRIILSNLEQGAGVERLIRRSSSSGHGFFNVVGLRSSVPWVRARARKVREAAPATETLPRVVPGDWILSLRLEDDVPYGKSLQQVEFKTGLERQPLVTLSVIVDVQPPVELPVERLSLQPSDGAVASTFPFSVREGLEAEALRIESRPAGLSVELQPGSNRAYTARVSWVGGQLDDGRLTFLIAGERYEMPVEFDPAQ